IRRLTRTYAVLSGINSTILRVHERAALLSESCNIAVRVGELALAMVVGPRRRGSERALASDGASPEVVSRIADWLVDEHSPSGFVARLTSARSPVVINDLHSDNTLGVTGDIVRADGHRALAVLP